MKVAAALMIGIGAPSVAAAACEREVGALEKAEGEAVGPAYAAIVACDATQGAAQFTVAMKRTKEAAALGELAKTAIIGGVVNPVHGMLDEITDYSAKDQVAKAVGAHCAADASVLAFVRGLHDALKDRAFITWSPAVAACPADEVTDDLEHLAKSPPARTFDDRYGKVVEIYGRRTGAEALPVLVAAGAAASDTGPFPVVLDAMMKAVTPDEFGAKPAPADLDKLVASLKELASKVGPEPAARVADTLVNLGQDAAAAELLPRIHPGMVQPGGGFLYGVAAVESCEGDAIVHWAVVEDPAARWSVTQAVEGPARAFKGKLKGCAADGWQILTTPGPVASAKDVEAWAEGVPSSAGVEDAKLREEKTLTLN